jgi:hypothetical protein
MKKLFVIALGITTLVACKKAKLNKQTTSFADDATAQAAFKDMGRVMEEVVDDDGNGTNRTAAYSFGNCATVTISPAWADSTFPKTIVVDFGTSNCTDNYGVKRRGKLIATVTDRYRNPGCKITINPQSYYVNDYKVEGTKIITNKGRNSNGNLEFSNEVNNGKVTNTNGETITWNSTRTNEWIAGENTFFNICDDVYSVTGYGNGVNREGRSYTVTITEPLIKSVCCRWISKGKLELAPDGLKTRKVDFGDGTCDNKATVEIGNRTYNISMW